MSKNRESIVDMNVRVLSGIKLNVFADQQRANGRGMYNVKTTYTKALAYKYQVKYKIALFLRIMIMLMIFF